VHAKKKAGQQVYLVIEKVETIPKTGQRHFGHISSNASVDMIVSNVADK
jgi:hypothetical protein